MFIALWRLYSSPRFCWCIHLIWLALRASLPKRPSRYPFRYIRYSCTIKRPCKPCDILYIGSSALYWGMVNILVSIMQPVWKLRASFPVDSNHSDENFSNRFNELLCRDFVPRRSIDNIYLLGSGRYGCLRYRGNCVVFMYCSPRRLSLLVIPTLGESKVLD